MKEEEKKELQKKERNETTKETRLCIEAPSQTDKQDVLKTPITSLNLCWAEAKHHTLLYWEVSVVWAMEGYARTVTMSPSMFLLFEIFLVGKWLK